MAAHLGGGADQVGRGCQGGVTRGLLHACGVVGSSHCFIKGCKLAYLCAAAAAEPPHSRTRAHLAPMQHRHRTHAHAHTLPRCAASSTATASACAPGTARSRGCRPSTHAAASRSAATRTGGAVAFRALQPGGGAVGGGRMCVESCVWRRARIQPCTCMAHTGPHARECTQMHARTRTHVWHACALAEVSPLGQRQVRGCCRRQAPTVVQAQVCEQLQHAGAHGLCARVGACVRARGHAYHGKRGMRCWRRTWCVYAPWCIPWFVPQRHAPRCVLRPAAARRRRCRPPPRPRPALTAAPTRPQPASRAHLTSAHNKVLLRPNRECWDRTKHCTGLNSRCEERDWCVRAHLTPPAPPRAAAAAPAAPRPPARGKPWA